MDQHSIDNLKTQPNDSPSFYQKDAGKYQMNLDGSKETWIGKTKKWWRNGDYDLNGEYSTNGEAVTGLVGLFAIIAALVVYQTYHANDVKTKEDNKDKCELRDNHTPQQAQTNAPRQEITCSLPKTFVMAKQNNLVNS